MDADGIAIRFGHGLPSSMSHSEGLARPDRAAAHLARKLAVHFVADAPDAGLVADLESV